MPSPWLYSPLLASPYLHPITRNLNLIKTEFTGCIDTLGARREIRKTVLLGSSQYSRQVTAPVLISLEEIRMIPEEKQFSGRSLPIAVLLEGSFESAFRNRMISALFPDTVVKFMEAGLPSSVLVIADADIIRNDVRPAPQGVYISPLGFDRFTQQTFGNKEFIVNALQYMTGHRDLINLRSRELTLRLLNKSAIRKDRIRWSLINTIIPPLVVVLTGLFYAWIRRRKYAGD
jgi:ABC-2 type transport system permease protein